MVRFIRLTSVLDGDSLFLNTDHIVQFRHNTGYKPKPGEPFKERPACTDVFLIDSGDYPVKVSETPEEILKMIYR